MGGNAYKVAVARFRKGYAVQFLKKIGIDPFIVALFAAIFLAWLQPDIGRAREPFGLGDAANWGVSFIFFFYGLRLTRQELRRLRDRQLTTLQFEAARKQLLGQIIVASDNNENNALGMAKTFLHYNRYETQSELFRRIEALTPAQLLDVAGDVLAEERLSVLIYD